MKKERVGHSCLGKLEFGAIYMFLERTDALFHMLIFSLKYLHGFVPIQWRFFQEKMFL
jgi:hypothetical protein